MSGLNQGSSVSTISISSQQPVVSWHDAHARAAVDKTMSHKATLRTCCMKLYCCSSRRAAKSKFTISNKGHLGLYLLIRRKVPRMDWLSALLQTSANWVSAWPECSLENYHTHVKSGIHTLTHEVNWLCTWIWRVKGAEFSTADKHR